MVVITDRLGHVCNITDMSYLLPQDIILSPCMSQCYPESPGICIADLTPLGRELYHDLWTGSSAVPSNFSIPSFGVNTKYRITLCIKSKRVHNQTMCLIKPSTESTQVQNQPKYIINPGTESNKVENQTTYQIKLITKSN